MGSLTIGIAENSAIGRTSFFGEAVDSTTVLIKATYAGDVDLDGDVDSTDYQIFTNNFGGPGIWSTGDMNYDGVLDASDDETIWVNQGLSGLYDNPPLGSLIPEPGAGLLAVAGVGAGMLRRRRVS